MQKEVSRTAYVIALIAGWLNIGVGIYVLYNPIMKIYEFYINNNDIGVPSYYGLLIGFYFLIFGVWIIHYAKFFRSVIRKTAKKAGVACVVLGILSLNVLSVISGAIGIVKGDR